MYLRKVYYCPLSCQNTRNYLLFNISNSWYAQRFQTTIQWKNLSRLLLKILYRPLVWVTKELWVKIKSEFLALCCCSELRCQESQEGDKGFLSSITATRLYSRRNILSWNRLWRHNQSRLQEECSSDRWGWICFYPGQQTQVWNSL